MFKASRFAGMVAVCALVVVGCSKKDAGTTAGGGTATTSGPKGGSCVETTSGVCTEYDDNTAGLAEAACGITKGTYGQAACSHDKTIGTCAGKGQTVYYYFANARAPWTEDAAEDCKTSVEGTFTPTPGAADNAKTNALPPASFITASCMHPEGYCEDLLGTSIAADLDKSMCQADGTYNAGTACPADKLVGTCLAMHKAKRFYTDYLKKTSSKPKELEKLCSEAALGYAHWYPSPTAVAAAATGSPSGKGGKH
jgi:hypothetical protein